MVVTLRHRDPGRLLVSGLAGMAILALAVVVALGDRAAVRHDLWSDPISWFAASEAPYPGATRVAMAVVGVVMAIIALRWWRATPGPAVLVGSLAVLVVALAAIPLECAPRVGFCRALMRHDMVGWQHLGHAGLAAVGVVTVMGASVWAGVRDRRLAAPPALLAVATGAWMLLDPANARLGTLQWIFLAAGAAAISRLGPPAAATRSSEGR